MNRYPHGVNPFVVLKNNLKTYLSFKKKSILLKNDKTNKLLALVETGLITCGCCKNS